MKPHEIRRTNLQALIDTRFAGKAGRLADAIGRKRPQIYRLFSDAENSRDIGEELARDIEKKLGIPLGQLDLENMTNDDTADVIAGYQRGGEDKKTAMKDIAELPEEVSSALRPIIDALKAKYGKA